MCTAISSLLYQSKYFPAFLATKMTLPRLHALLMCTSNTMLLSARKLEGICKNLLWHNLFFKDVNLGTRDLWSLMMIMLKGCGCEREEALVTKEVVVEIPILHVLVHQNLVIEQKPTVTSPLSFERLTSERAWMSTVEWISFYIHMRHTYNFELWNSDSCFLDVADSPASCFHHKSLRASLNSCGEAG